MKQAVAIGAALGTVVCVLWVGSFVLSGSNPSRPAAALVRDQEQVAAVPKKREYVQPIADRYIRPYIITFGVRNCMKIK